MSLVIKNLFISLGEKQIIKGVNLRINPGELHVLMGPNGSGKSTFAQGLMGNPQYKFQISNFKFQIDKKDMIDLKPDERGRAGLFLAFQNPIGIPGVSAANLLKTAYQVIHPQVKNNKVNKFHNPALTVWEFNEMLVKKAKTLSIPQEFLGRSLNEEFSGGEKKKLEMLQAIVLKPKFAIFDEIDTGLDVDALKIVAHGIEELIKVGTGVLVITHYQRILKFAKPDFVHVLIDGKIIQSGGYQLAEEIEKTGYKKWIGKQND